MAHKQKTLIERIAVHYQCKAQENLHNCRNAVSLGQLLHVRINTDPRTNLSSLLILVRKCSYHQDKNIQLSSARVNTIISIKIRNPVYCSALLFTTEYVLGSHFWTPSNLV